MKIENISTPHIRKEYTATEITKTPQESFDAVLNNSTAPIVSNAPTDSLLLLLQGTNAYTGYVESVIENDILTESERQYLLTGDIERIEKKNVMSS